MNEEQIKDLKEHVRARGLTQESLAELFGVSQANISALLNGKTPFGKGVAASWEEKLGIRAAWLMIGDGKMLKSGSVIQHGRGSVQVQGHGNVDTVVGEMHGGTINHNGGKDMMIDEQKKEVDKMFEAIIIAVNGFQKASERHDDYVVRQDDYIKRQDEYIARIINHSYLRNKENMERLDVQLTQQNKLIEMVLDQNRRTQDRADRLVDMLEKKL